MTRSVAALLCLGGWITLAAADDAETKPEKKPDEKPIAVAVKGTPKIDGKIDEAWEKASKVKVAKPVKDLQVMNEKLMATATVQLMWDDAHLYALWQVTDKQLSGSARDPWEQDSVELFLDENNRKTPFYQFDDAQYRVSFAGEISGQGEGFFAESVRAATQKTDQGYLVEMKITVNEPKLKTGDKLGLELQINDDGGDGSRGAVAKWNHAEDDSWESTRNFGTLELK